MAQSPSSERDRDGIEQAFAFKKLPLTLTLPSVEDMEAMKAAPRMEDWRLVGVLSVRALAALAGTIAPSMMPRKALGSGYCPRVMSSETNTQDTVSFVFTRANQTAVEAWLTKCPAFRIPAEVRTVGELIGALKKDHPEHVLDMESLQSIAAAAK